MDNQVLRGVVANVQVTKAALTCGVTKRLLERELDELGAKTLARLTKSCTHIVFQRKTDEPSDEDRAADEETARQLSVKAEKLGCGVLLVRSTWIAASRDQGCWAAEGQHAVIAPKIDPVVQRLRKNTTPRPSTGKKRAAPRARQPAAAEEFEMSQLMTSSQQIERADDSAECMSPPPTKRQATGRATHMAPLPEPTNFDTQACADVMMMDLGVASRSASPASGPAPATERGKGAKAKAKPAAKAAEKQARGRRAGTMKSAAGEAAEQPTAATAALAALAEQLAPTEAAPAAAHRSGRHRVATSPEPEDTTPAQQAGEPAVPAAATADVPGLPRPQAPQQRKAPAGKLAPRARVSGQGAFKPPRLAALAAKRDSAAAAAAAAAAEYAAAMAADAEAEAAEAAAAFAAAQAPAEAAAPEQAAVAGEEEERLEAFTQRQPEPRGPSLRALAAAPERSIAISVATPAGFRPSASPIVPQPVVVRDAAAIAVPGVLRLPTPAETLTSSRATPASQDTPASAAAHPGRATSGSVTVAAMPQMPPPRQREPPWSAPRPWDPASGAAQTDAAEAADAAEGAEAAAPAGQAQTKSKQRKAAAKGAAATPKPARAERKRGAADTPAPAAEAAPAVAPEAEAPEAEAVVQSPGSGRKRAAPGTSGRAAAAADMAEAEGVENQDPEDSRPLKRRCAEPAAPVPEDEPIQKAGSKAATAADKKGGKAAAGAKAGGKTLKASSKAAAAKASGKAGKANSKMAAAKEGSAAGKAGVKTPAGKAAGKAGAVKGGGAAAAASGFKAARGVITTSNTQDGLKSLAVTATKELPGLRLYQQGADDGRITHLVLGDHPSINRRTMKVMLAVANGAHLLSPEWLSASREAGRWLPEADFAVECQFLDAAERARQAREQKKPLRPLDTPQSREVYVHGPVAPMAGASKPDLDRLVNALGGKVVGIKDCKLCVVAGRGRAPKNLPAAVPALHAEWLLAAAAGVALPKVEKDHVVDP